MPTFLTLKICSPTSHLSSQTRLCRRHFLAWLVHPRHHRCNMLQSHWLDHLLVEVDPLCLLFISQYDKYNKSQPVLHKKWFRLGACQQLSVCEKGVLTLTKHIFTHIMIRPRWFCERFFFHLFPRWSRCKENPKDDPTSAGKESSNVVHADDPVIPTINFRWVCHRSCSARRRV